MRIQSSPHLEGAGVQTIVLHCLLNCPDSQVIRTKALRSSLNMSIPHVFYGGIGLTFTGLTHSVTVSLAACPASPHGHSRLKYTTFSANKQQKRTFCDGTTRLLYPLLEREGRNSIPVAALSSKLKQPSLRLS